MANRLLNRKMDDLEADGASVVGKVVNVYDTYEHALAHGSTGLCTINDVDESDGSVGSAITQVAKATGVTIDNNGKVAFYVNDDSYSEVFLMTTAGRQGGPLRMVVQ